MKRIIFIALLLIISMGSFAQENTISGGLGIGLSYPLITSLGGFRTYERDFNEALTVCINASGQWYWLSSMLVWMLFGFNGEINIFEYAFDAQARFYPFEEKFYIAAGIGYGDFMALWPCLVITPEIGWKFDRGFTINSSFRIRGECFIPLNKIDSEKVFNIVFLWGIGYTF